VGREAVGRYWSSCGPCALRKPAAPMLCHWATSGFSPLAFDLFLYFLNIFESLQIQKFV
jgi:hypothetical protein